MQTQQLEPGQVIGGDFRILQPLAAGGMGAVYLAEQRSTGKRRALKVMHLAIASDPASVQRFVREAQVGARIESEHVVEVIGAGVDERTGLPWLAMELLEGDSLAALVERRGPLQPAELVRVFRQITHALEAAHRVGVVHRDLKPENVLVAVSRRSDTPFTVKILDFGIAKLVASATSAHNSQLIGSPLWMAPEQLQPNAPIGPATDVWALGLLAFHLLTARYYWLSANHTEAGIQALIAEMVVAPLVPASDRARVLGASVPPGFDGWFARAVAREPAARFASVRELQDALERALGGGGAMAGAGPAGAVTGAPAQTVVGGPSGAQPAWTPAAASSGARPVAPVAPTALQVTPPPITATRPTPGATGRSPLLLAGAALLGLGVLGAAAAAIVASRGGRTDPPAAPPAVPTRVASASEAPEPVPAAVASNRPGASPVAATTPPADEPPPQAEAEADAAVPPGDLMAAMRTGADGRRPARPEPATRGHASSGGAVPVAVTEPALPARPTPATLRAALARLAPQVADCAPAASADTVRVAVTFAPSGRVARARVGPPLAGRAEGTCVARVVARATVPPFSGAPVDVSYPYRLRRSAGATPPASAAVPAAGAATGSVSACGSDCACVLRFPARSEREASRRIACLRQQGNRAGASREMRQYVRRYPSGSSAAMYRMLLEREGN